MPQEADDIGLATETGGEGIEVNYPPWNADKVNEELFVMIGDPLWSAHDTIQASMEYKGGNLTDTSSWEVVYETEELRDSTDSPPRKSND